MMSHPASKSGLRFAQHAPTLSSSLRVFRGDQKKIRTQAHKLFSLWVWPSRWKRLYHQLFVTIIRSVEHFFKRVGRSTCLNSLAHGDFGLLQKFLQLRAPRLGTTGQQVSYLLGKRAHPKLQGATIDFSEGKVALQPDHQIAHLSYLLSLVQALLNSGEKFCMKAPACGTCGLGNAGFQLLRHAQRVGGCLMSVCSHPSIVDVQTNLYKESR